MSCESNQINGMEEAETAKIPPDSNQSRTSLWRLTGIILLLLLMACLILAFVQWKTSIYRDPNFVATVYQPLNVDGMDSLESVLIRLHYWQEKFGPDPPFYPSILPQQPRLYSVKNLLSECTEYTGVRYLVDKHLIDGDLRFGHTNILNSRTWVQAAESALEHGSLVEWHDPQTKQLRMENLVLIRYGKRTVLVLPKEKASAYQRN